eukprot:9013804-Pyramimonas_sp.AAC.1
MRGEPTPRRWWRTPATHGAHAGGRHGGLPPGPLQDHGGLLLQLQPPQALSDGVDEVVFSG